jgi:hypothetical protein
LHKRKYYCFTFSEVSEQQEANGDSETGLTIKTGPANAYHREEKQMEFFEERPKVNLEIDKDGKVLSLKRTYKSKPIDPATRTVTKLPLVVE